MYEVVDHRHLDGTSAIYLPGVAVGDRSLKSAKPIINSESILNYGSGILGVSKSTIVVALKTPGKKISQSPLAQA